MPAVTGPLPAGCRAVVHGAGLARVGTLPGLLAGVELLRPRLWRAGPSADVVLAWGRKPSAQRAQAWAAARQLPVCWLEDGFLRSVGLGDRCPPWSVVVDDLGIYYDARQPSRLEALIAQPRDAVELARGEALATLWREHRVSKYNAARERPDLVAEGDVLVVDQTWGDASIACGQADAGSFRRMLEAALDERPRARVLLKVHPDVLAGRKRGHFGSLSPGQAARVRWLAEPAHPAGLLPHVAAVYVVTSQMGFEALLWQRPVRCFGMPFYAGWGLTQDALPAPVRRGTATLPALTLAALADYPRYLDPETGLPCEPERLLDWMGLQRRQRERFAPQLQARGFSRWKRPLVRAFLAGSEVSFQPASAPLPASGGAVVVWGRTEVPPEVQRPVLRLEDGFLRSVGLGADLVRPLSWVVDTRGIYYDTRQPSGLTELLMDRTFDATLCDRAARLRQAILAAGVTKYNVGGARWCRPAAAGSRPVVLVVGQVESDAALRYGAPGVCTNLALVQAARRARPDAWLVYKPHPDVVARLRAQGEGEDSAARHCDEVLPPVAMDALLGAVDAVHVMTSLAGFEALMRGTPVTVWGCPFYAGWGLTDDRQAQPAPRRPLSLDALVAGVLILYPTYVSRTTGHFCSPEQALAELAAWRRQPASAGLALMQPVRRVVLRWAAWWRRRQRL